MLWGGGGAWWESLLIFRDRVAFSGDTGTLTSEYQVPAHWLLQLCSIPRMDPEVGRDDVCVKLE